MATAHSRGKITAGSAEWVGDERISTLDFVKQETEEFAFSVRNEMDWLNEHMAEVFNRSQLSVLTFAFSASVLTCSSDVVEAFKTPGKLRAKTPRTTRRPNAFESRAVRTNDSPTCRISNENLLAFDKSVFFQHTAYTKSHSRSQVHQAKLALSGCRRSR